MVESKSVKVDNWGVFFLQKLQNFFNKTDYCDLTLQFMDNSQLKVHRLVLSACTDYFNVLEQQCEINDDILTMPYDLQADVVVPIVNFMYTGTLEFEVTMYSRLLKTAKDMNMTVLLKLLEAHKRTVNVAAPIRSAPVLLNKGAQRQAVSIGSRVGGPQRTLQHRRVPDSPTLIKTEGGVPKVAGRVMAVNKKAIPEPVRLVSKYGASSSYSQVKGPSRFECNEEQVNPDQFETSFDDISYESRPLTTASQIKKEERRSGDASGSFEQLRKGYTGVKRPASSLGSESPPQKKPNIQDVKEYTEAHKLRKKIVAEEFNDEEEDESLECADKTGPSNSNETTLIGGKGADNVDHAKIISEVLKKYPHLVKNNKNIKLKITQKGQQHTITAPLRSVTGPSSSSTPKASSATAQKTISRPNVVEKRIQVPSRVVPKPEPVATPSTSKTVVNEAINPAGPKKIDSRTMHALIAKGAENVSGPWLCLKCGVNGRPISIPSYKGFRRHLINVHKLKIDPKLCENCGWKSTSKEELHHHILVVHNINPPPDMKFPRCVECKFVAIDQTQLKAHMSEKHPSKVTRANAQHCIYCNKTFTDETRLYDHMRSNHRDRAREDGVMDTDDEDLEDEDEYLPNLQPASIVKDKSKIQVLSNITIQSKGVPYAVDSNSQAISSIAGSSATETTCKLEPSSEAEGLTNVATGIAASLGMLDTEHLEEEANSSQDESNISAYLEDEMASVHGENHNKDKETEEDAPVDGGEAQFVSEEGSTLNLTETQKAELIQQLQDKQGVVMILNEDGFGANATEENDNQLKAENMSIDEEDEAKPSEENLVFESGIGDAVKDETNSNNHQKAVSEKEEDGGEEEQEEEEDDDEAEPSASENVEPTSTVPASSAKTLIEGDWTDDDEDVGDDGEIAKPESPSPQYESNQPEESSPEITAKPSARSYKGREGRSSNDSIKETNPTQDSGIEEKTSKDTDGESDTPAASQLLKEEILSINVPPTDEEELKKASKIEIKTLINDWGDDDDDENLD